MAARFRPSPLSRGVLRSGRTNLHSDLTHASWSAVYVEAFTNDGRWPSTLVERGVKTRVKGTVTWDITSGIIGALQFVTLANGGFTARPNTDPVVVDVHSTERALSGVRKADLNDSGTTSAGGTVANLQYRGVICP